jgi:rRNA-processing protein FCF1
MKIILDTNFLVDCIRFKIDLKSELAGSELFVLDALFFEMENIVRRGTYESKLAKLALNFVESNSINILETEGSNVDDSLISYSKQGYEIATNDKELRGRLKKVGSKIIYIRQKRYLVIPS